MTEKGNDKRSSLDNHMLSLMVKKCSGGTFPIDYLICGSGTPKEEICLHSLCLQRKVKVAFLAELKKFENRNRYWNFVIRSREFFIGENWSWGNGNRNSALHVTPGDETKRCSPRLYCTLVRSSYKNITVNRAHVTVAFSRSTISDTKKWRYSMFIDEGIF